MNYNGMGMGQTKRTPVNDGGASDVSLESARLARFFFYRFFTRPAQIFNFG